MIGKTIATANTAFKNGGYIESISMAAPDIILLELRDAKMDRGGLEYHPGHGGDHITDGGIWRSRTNLKGQTRAGWTIGLNDDWIRFADNHPSVVLNRTATKDPSKWDIVGAAISVQAVYFAAEPVEGTFWTGGVGGVARQSAGMRYSVWLHLSGPLTNGQYRIRFPAETGYGDQIFNYNDRTTRAWSIVASIVGHRPDDPWKQARLYAYVPGHPNHGAVELITAYGLTEFYMVDMDGNNVAGPYPIAAGAGPSDPEPFAVMGSELVLATNPYGFGISPLDRKTMNYVSTSDVANIIAVSTGVNPSTLTFAPGHPFVDGDIIVTGTLSGVTNNGGWYRLASGVGDTFEVYQPVTDVSPTFGGTYNPSGQSGPICGKGAKMYESNASLSWVHHLDYTEFAPTEAGYYKVYVPGLGTSDPIYFGMDAWLRPAKMGAAGEYNQRWGSSMDGRFGYRRPVAGRGNHGTTYYKTRLPCIFAHQGGLLSGTAGNIDYQAAWNGNTEAWHYGRTPEFEIDAGGEWMDAGDYDVISHIHASCFQTIYQLYRALTPAQRARLNLGTPKSSEPHIYLGAEYAELDSVPNIVHQMVWAIAWQKRCQEANGAVPGGCAGDSEGRTGTPAAQYWDPSHLWYSKAYTFAPDHLSNYVYAGQAVLLGRILIDEGCPILGQSFIDSGVLAYEWAEDIYRHIRRV
jgi:endoglucanase